MGRVDVAKVGLTSARDWQEVRSFFLPRAMRTARSLLGSADKGSPQRQGSTHGLLDEGRQLVVDHYAEIEECPGAVHHSAIR